MQIWCSSSSSTTRPYSKIQQEEGFKKKEKAPRRRTFSSFSNNKKARKEGSNKKEWCDLTRKSDVEMKKWLSAGEIVLPGWTIGQESASKCGLMEMVFYDNTTS